MPSDYDDDEFGDDDYYEDRDEFGEEDGFSEVNFDEDEDSPDYGDEWSDEAIGLKSSADESSEADPEDASADDSEAAFDPGQGAAPAADLGDDPLAELLAGIAAPDDELAWRETYFVLFQRHDRPTLTQVEAAIGGAGGRLVMEDLKANDDGLFQSVIVQSPEDNAALEVSYEEGEAVMQESAELAKQLQKQIDSQVLAQLLRADARLDVMHFERMDDQATFEMGEADDIALESLNPATLIGVVEALANLTGGVPIDPAAGEVML